MDTIQNYKCPCCGASLIFQNESLHCDSCGNDFELDAMRQMDASVGTLELNISDADEIRAFIFSYDNKIKPLLPSARLKITGS